VRHVVPAAARLGQLVGVLLAVAVVTFLLQTALPGDAAETRIGDRRDLTFQQRQNLLREVREELGLDQPLPVQFWEWLTHAVRFDFGVGVNGQTVRTLVGPRIWPTVELILLASVIAAPLAALLAVATARRRRRASGVAVNAVVVTLFVTPVFWLGYLFVLLFAVELKILPASGYVPLTSDVGEHLKHIALPALTLALSQTAVYFRYIQSDLSAALESEYVRTARAKGLSNRTILFRHALPNALLPALTIFAVNLGAIIGPIVVVEQIFGWPGLGSLLLTSIINSDYNTVVAVVLLIAAGYVVISMTVDWSHRFLDPRVRKA